MRIPITILALGLAALGILTLGLTAQGNLAAAADSDAGKGEQIETVRKTCECVRRHPNGFPYIEPRIVTCRTYKNSEGHVKSLDCLNCYSLCSDRPAG